MLGGAAAAQGVTATRCLCTGQMNQCAAAQALTHIAQLHFHATQLKTRLAVC